MSRASHKVPNFQLWGLALVHHVGKAAHLSLFFMYPYGPQTWHFVKRWHWGARHCCLLAAQHVKYLCKIIIIDFLHNAMSDEVDFEILHSSMEMFLVFHDSLKKKLKITISLYIIHSTRYTFAVNVVFEINNLQETNRKCTHYIWKLSKILSRSSGFLLTSSVFSYCSYSVSTE